MPEYPTETVEQLREVHRLVKKGWTQGTFTRNKSGGIVPIQSSAGVCWCITGAVRRATHHPIARELLYKVLHQSIAHTGFVISGLHHHEDWVVAFNDTAGRTQKEAVAVVEAAIKIA